MSKKSKSFADRLRKSKNGSTTKRVAVASTALAVGTAVAGAIARKKSRQA